MIHTWQQLTYIHGLGAELPSQVFNPDKQVYHSLIKGIDDNHYDDHEYYYYHHHDHHHHHHHHRHGHHYHHVPSTGYLYVILTLHLNQNHLGTSGQYLVSLRKGHLSD